MSDPRPLLTICVGTVAGWPEIEPCLRSFLDQARAVGAEVIVGDGSGRPPPEDPELRSAVTWRSDNERSIFRVVAANLRQASGEIVAMTEDHCTVRPGWVEAILRAHAEFPDAGAIGGAIENGTTADHLEWASYLMTQGAHMAPLRRGAAARIANEANVSFKRHALDELTDEPLGFMTIRFTQDLAARGVGLANDDRIVVDHRERLGPRATAIIHFDDGRTISGFRRATMARGDWLRLLAAPLLPLYRTARVVRNGIGKGRAKSVIPAVPWIIVLEYCHAAGEFVGYLAGAGRSPYGLR